MRNYLSTVAATVVGFGLVIAAPAQAAAVIDSSAYSLQVNLSVLNIAGVGVGPLTASGGGAPGSYTDAEQTVGINQNLDISLAGLIGVRERIQTGVLTTAAQSPYSGLIGSSQTGSARAQVDNLASRLGIFTAPVIGSPTFGNLLTISARTVVSRSTVAGAGGVASATGFTQLEGLVISGTLLGGAVLDGSLFVNPDPNTVLFSLGLLGSETLKIILNEQVRTGNGAPGISGTPDAGISTNAIRIIFSDLNVAGVGLLRGNIVIAHSQARIFDAVAEVPEPATWIQMIGGFALIGVVTRRARRRIAA